MSNITAFSGAPHEYSFRNYVEPFTIWITSGSIIPEGAVIERVTFTFQAKIWAGVSDKFYIHDVDWGTPTNNGSSWNNTGSNSCISSATQISVDSDTKSSWTFTGNDRAKSSVKATNYINISVYRTKYKTSGNTGYVYADLPLYCTVEWRDTEYIPTPPSSAYFSNNSVTPGALVTLNWSKATLPSDASNKILGYEVHGYLTNDTNNSETPGIYAPSSFRYPYFIDGANITSCSFNAPNTTGTYYYRVDPVTLSSEGEVRFWNNGTIYVPLIVAVSAIGSPSGLKVNGATSFYLGEIGSPALSLSWTAASGGINNPVASYNIYRGGNLWRTGITGTSYNLPAGDEAGVYHVSAVPTVSGYGATLSTGNVNIFKITTKPVISLTSSSSITTDQNAVVTWTAADYVGGGTATYKIKKTIDGASSESFTTGTSYDFNTSTELTPGKTATIEITPRYVTTAGGYTEGNAISCNITRSSAFTVGNDFWDGCYDSDNGYESGLYNHAYFSITLSWKQMTASESSGSSFSYVLEQQIDNGAFTTIGTQTGTTYTKNIRSLTEGTVLGFRMKITNEYGTISYSPTWTVNKVVSPTLGTIAVSGITYKKIQTSFVWNRGSLPSSADKMKYIIQLSYKGQDYILKTGEITEATTSPLVQELSVDLSNTNLRNALQSLANDVLIDRKAYPQATITVRVEYEHYTEAHATGQLNITLNYTTEPTKYGHIFLEEEKGWYNPQDVIAVKLSDFEWKDASGESNNSMVTNYLSSSFSTNKFNFINNRAEIIAPSTNSDLAITFTLKTSIAYAEVTKEYTSTETIPVNIARWTQEPVLIDSLTLLADKTALEGYIQLPERLCSSAVYSNLSSLFIRKISPESSNYTTIFYGKQNGQEVVGPSFNKNSIPTDRRIRFTMSHNTKEYNDVTAQFELVFTNNSSKTITVTTNPYRYFVADIDMAVRKGRVGINVSEEFGREEHPSNSALQINANPQAQNAIIAEVLHTNRSTSSNPTNFLLLQDGSISSKIWSDGASLFIDKLAIPDLTANRLVITDNSGKLVSSEVNPSELSYLSGLEGNIQEQLDNKSPAITGAASTVVTNGLTAGRVLVSNSSQKIAVSTVTSTELSYLSGVTSSIQTQINNKFNTPGSQTQNRVFASPNGANGAPSFRQLEEADIPNLPTSKITSGTWGTSRGGTGSANVGAKAGAALNNLGISYGQNEPTLKYEGLIWLKPKG